MVSKNIDQLAAASTLSDTDKVVVAQGDAVLKRGTLAQFRTLLAPPMPEATVKGRAFGAGAGVPQDLTATQARAAMGISEATLDARYLQNADNPQPTFASRAAVAAATVPNTARTLRTEFFAPSYAVPATLVGGAVYRRASFADLTGYPALSYVRSVDRFLPNGTTDATNGGYWLVLPDRGEVELEQFGALADGATDDYAAINAAFEYAGLASTPVAIVGRGRVYRHSLPFVVNSGQAAVSDASNVNFDGIPRINFISKGDMTLLATAAMDQQLFLTDAGGGTPAPNWMKIEGIKFDGNNLAVRNIRTFFCSNVEVTRCKFVRATYGYWNEGFGIATIKRNAFFNQFCIYNIKGGDNWFTENDFYPRLNGAAIVKGASTGNDRILQNVVTVDPAQYPADGVQLNGNLTSGVTVGVNGICNIRNAKIEGNEFNGVRYAVAGYGMTAAQKTTWLTARPTDAWPFANGETIWDVQCHNNHAFAAADAAKPIIMYYFSDIRGIVVTNSTLSSTDDTVLPGASLLQTVRCQDIRAANNTSNLVETPAYFFESKGAVYTGNSHRGCGLPANNALVVFDGSICIYRINTFDRFRAAASSVAFVQIGGGSLNKGDNIDLNATHAMTVLN